jgi:hypothetical protein
MLQAFPGTLRDYSQAFLPHHGERFSTSSTIGVSHDPQHAKHGAIIFYLAPRH